MSQRGTIGLDLSLRSSGACFIPRGWKGDTTKCKVGTWGRDSTGTERDKVKRMIEIAEGIVTFCAKHLEPGATVYVESHP